MLKRMLWAVILATGLAGCALSPQNVSIAPIVPEHQTPVDLDGPIEVTVYDERATPWLGSRGGVYRESSLIQVGNDLPMSVKNIMEEELAKLGMVTGAGSDAPQLQLYVDKISYDVPEGKYITEVDLSASLRVTIFAGDRTYEGQYSASDNYRVLRSPSDEKNQEMINTVLGKAMGKALSDPGLLRFLARI